MKILLIIILVAAFFSCSKSGINNPPIRPFTDTSHILEKVDFFVTITKPSPFDSAHNFSKDSLKINYNRLVGAPDYLQNRNVSFNITSFFTFGIDTTNFKTTGNETFTLLSGMLPDFNSSFVTNKMYQNTYSGDYLIQPFFLSMHRGNGIGVGRYFLSQDSIPEDATPFPQVKIVCSLIITKKYTVPISNGYKATIVDGKITGSYEARYGKTDFNKYVSSFDYQCNFQGITLNN